MLEKIAVAGLPLVTWMGIRWGGTDEDLAEVERGRREDEGGGSCGAEQADEV